MDGNRLLEDESQRNEDLLSVMGTSNHSLVWARGYHKPRKTKMSKAIRIYEHARNGKRLTRLNFNTVVGLQYIQAILDTGRHFSICAVGCEEGAMAFHYRWRN